MYMLLDLLYKIAINKTKYKKGWMAYVIYPFIWVRYLITAQLIIKTIIGRTNNKLPFKDLLVEYACFLTAVARMNNPDEPDINELILYETTGMFVTYDKEDKVKSISYVFTQKESDMTIKVDLNEKMNLMTASLETKSGNISFSFNSLVNSKLVDARNNIEQIIRTDIAANLYYLIIHNKY